MERRLSSGAIPAPQSSLLQRSCATEAFKLALELRQLLHSGQELAARFFCAHVTILFTNVPIIVPDLNLATCMVVELKMPMNVPARSRANDDLPARARRWAPTAASAGRIGLLNSVHSSTARRSISLRWHGSTMDASGTPSGARSVNVSTSS